jgi:hypothetical protein
MHCRTSRSAMDLNAMFTTGNSDRLREKFVQPEDFASSD